MNESMHRNHDLDLISALAEGKLADPTEALELVDSCPECAGIYHSHLTVRRAVENAEPVEMSDLERRRVRMAVWDRLETAAPPVRRTGTPWWYRIAPVAAALVVVVGVGGVILTVGQGGDTTAAGTAAPAELSTAGGESDSGQPRDEAALEAPADTAVSETTAAGQAEDQAFAADTTAAAGTEEAGVAPTEMRERVALFTDRYLAGEASIDDDFSCWEATQGEGDVLAAEAEEVEGTPVWFVALGEADELTAVVVYDRIDCTVVFRDE